MQIEAHNRTVTKSLPPVAKRSGESSSCFPGLQSLALAVFRFFRYMNNIPSQASLDVANAIAGACSVCFTNEE